MDNIFVAEMVGTAILILLGDGVVANVLLKDSKGEGSGWIVITAGWGFAVPSVCYAARLYSGAHLNPAVTIGLAVGDLTAWERRSAVPRRRVRRGVHRGHPGVPRLLEPLGGDRGPRAEAGRVLHWPGATQHRRQPDDGDHRHRHAADRRARHHGHDRGRTMGCFGLGRGSTRCSSASWCGASASRSVARPDTPSTRHGTCHRGSPMRSSRSRARATPTGTTPGSRWSGRSSAASSASSCTTARPRLSRRTDDLKDRPAGNTARPAELAIEPLNGRQAAPGDPGGTTPMSL